MRDLLLVFGLMTVAFVAPWALLVGAAAVVEWFAVQKALDLVFGDPLAALGGR